MRTASATTLLIAGILAVPACGTRQGTASPGADSSTQCCRSTVYEVPEVDDPPSFPGGEPALFAWVGNHLNHPAKAIEGGQGTCWVRFNVECDGRLVDAHVQRGVEAELDSAALRLVRDMPVWTPGKLKGTAVCVQYLLPVTFTQK